LPKDLPAFIEVDLSTLAVGQSIHVSDLTLPAGVTAVTRGGESPVVATAIVPRVIAEVEEVVAVVEPGAVVEGAPVEAGKEGEKAPEKGAEKSAEKGAEKGSEKSAEKAPAKKDAKK
jgi:large subunit ribosomal protein L25